MKIPKRFVIAGIPVTVEKAKLIADHQMLAQCVYHEQKILIDTGSTPEETIQQTLWHEILHWCFYVLGRETERCDENLVDSLAHVLYQVVTTMEYEDEQQGEGVSTNSGKEAKAPCKKG